MRFIQKKPEPVRFTRWKQMANEDWQPDWDDNFQNPEKPDVLNALLIEQGYICCYCGKRISPTHSHIEHLKPREQCIGDEEKLKLAYDNFLASCPGYPEEEKHRPEAPKPRQESCGHKKANWYDPDLMVSPLDPNCDKYFQYPDDGQITATEDPAKRVAALETIHRLGLDNDKLSKVREEAIAGLGITDLTLSLSADEIRQFIDGLNQPDSSGELEPFCFALIYQLQQFLPP
jgi:uncharacterized protein (TIGR02646 family)